MQAMLSLFHQVFIPFSCLALTSRLREPLRLLKRLAFVSLVFQSWPGFVWTPETGTKHGFDTFEGGTRHGLADSHRGAVRCQ